MRTANSVGTAAAAPWGPEAGSWGSIGAGLWGTGPPPQAENELPQPQVPEAFGLLKMNPRPMSPSWKSTSTPFR